MDNNQQADFTSQRIEGFVKHSGNPFSVPLFSEIVDGQLWMGGCPVETPPPQFDYIVSLYPWGAYELHPHQIQLLWGLMDSTSQSLERERLLAVAQTIKKFMSVGRTLVHCQAGLNRSGLLTALTLMLHGFEAQATIDMLRRKRCSEVLCNPHFVQWLLEEQQRMRNGVVS